MQTNSGSVAGRNDQQLGNAGAPEPIAIVGLGCRFPGGAHDAESFWSMLSAGVDAISEVPKDRFSSERFWDSHPDKPGKSRSRWGGFVDQQVELFDALFFGMSPREAAYLDPMQRWLLEVSWEAFEDAGIVPGALAGSDTAVFIGGFTEDIKLLQMDPSNRHLLGPHAATGSAMTMLANRLSYFYDLRGPSVALDTACSSSLVATHLACQSIWSGESARAIAGGVNAMFRPEYTIAESKAGMLSPDGRSKAFDSRANGYVRGEGAGIVVLERLSTAVAAGRRIYAVIRGTAVNQDGHTNGITVPNGQAQQALIRAACERAGISPGEIRYVEAHGTGTPVGDPIEVNALGQALSESRAQDDTCWIGSVKTNMGHLEAAAGIAGLIKASLVLSHARIPPHLHLRQANPAIDFERLRLRVPDRLVDFPSDGRRLASVNSFGFGGTNAHVVLEAAPAPAEPPSAMKLSRPALLTLSATTEAALSALASAHAARWSREILDERAVHDIAHSTRQHRSHHDFRLTVRTSNPAELCERLAAAAAKQPAAGVVSGRRAREPQAPVFVFSGMGPQWWGMGQGLLQKEPVFRQAVEECDAFFAPLAGWSLISEMLRDESSSRVARTDVAQPTSFALQVGLDRLWRSFGVLPSAIVGHSAGEVAAAYSADVYSLGDAVKIIYHRSRLQQRTTGQGKLAALGVSYAEAREAQQGYEGRISIAAVNGPRAVTLVGDVDSLKEFLRPFEEREAFVRYLQVDVPYHSHYMDPLQEELLETLADIQPRPARTPLYSSVTGQRSEGTEWTARYWWQNVRQSVLFAAAVETLRQAEHDTFLELGAHPVLGSAISESFAEGSSKATVFASLRRKSDDVDCMLDALAAIYVAGADLDLASLSSAGARYVPLPFYPFQREAHWAESAASRRDRLGEEHHPLLGHRARSPQKRFEVELSVGRVQYLADHVVRGSIVFPGAGYVEMMLAALQQQLPNASVFELCDVGFHKALFLRADRNATLELDLDTEQHALAVFSRADDDGEQWQKHASATFRVLAQGTAPRATPSQAQQDLQPVTVDDCYRYLTSLGLEYGPAFRGIRELHTGPLRAAARVELEGTLRDANYQLHPALLDACFQVILAATMGMAASGEPRVYLPTQIRSLRATAEMPATLWVSAEISAFDEQTLTGSLQARDAEGRVVLELLQVHARSVENLQASGPSLADLMYAVSFQEEALEEPAPAAEAGSWLVLSDGGPRTQALTSALEARGQRAVLVRFGSAFTKEQGGFTVDPCNPSDFKSLFAAAFSQTDTTWRGFLHAAALDDASPGLVVSDAVARAEARGPVALLHALQALEASSQPLRISVVTRAVQPAGGEQPSGAPLDAAVWGMLRGVAYQEAPHRFGGLFDLGWEAQEAELSQLVEDLVRGTADEVAYRGSARFVARFVPKPALAEPPSLPRFRADASYLITGGLGGLGMLVARFMVARGARRLILMGRSPLPERSAWRSLEPESLAGRRASFIRDLEARGASVHLAAVDVADELGLRAFLDDYEARAYPPIRGVVHAAGVSEPRLLSELTQAEYARTARPKVQGALLLDDLLGDTLDTFVMFSSVAAFAFTAGQGDYASANAVLDALAHDRRRRGRPALSINFGPWAEAGMATLLGEYFENRGMTPFSVELGLQALGQLMGQGVPQATVLWISDPLAFRERNFSSTSRLHFIQAVASEAGRDAKQDANAAGLNLAAEIFAVDEPALQRERALLALRSLLSRVLRLELGAVDPERTLNQLGLDSLLAVELKNRLMTELEVNFPVVELLRDTTIFELGNVLHERLRQRLQGSDAEPAQRSTASALPLGPNQHWFFSRRLENPHQWNMAALWEVTRPVRADQLQSAVAAVLARHELLRARFIETPSGWEQRILDDNGDIPSAVISLADVPQQEQDSAIERYVAERQAKLHLSLGPLLDVTYFDLGPKAPGRLLTVIHHVVSDVFSQQVVVADIELACQQLERGGSVRLPPPSDGYGEWVQRLSDYAERGASPEERRYWLEQSFEPAPLPVDFVDGRAKNSIASGRLLTASLDVVETRALSRAVPAAFRAHMLEVLLTAFAAALRDWSGHERALLDVIVHGRETPGQDMDLGRTVGLFAHGIPLALELPKADSLAEQLNGIRQQLAPFQAQGRTFAALRWLGKDAKLVSHLASIPRRELIFNYIGQFESSHDEGALFRVVPVVPRALEAAENERDFLLQCQVGVLNGKLTLLLSYSENVHRRSSIEKLAHGMLDALRAFARSEQTLESREAS